MSDTNSKPKRVSDLNDLSIQEIYFTIKKHRKIISFITAVVLFLALVITFTQKSVYQAKGMIMIEDSSSTFDIFELGMGNEKNFLQNEREILLSRTTAERAVKQLLNSKHRNNLFLFGTREYDHLWRNIFSSNKAINISSVISDSLFSVFVEKLRQQMIVTNNRNTDMLNIIVDSNDPNEAALLVNTIIDVYRTIDLEWATGELSHLKSFLIDQINKKEIELSLAEETLRSYQEREKIFGVDENAKLLLNNLIEAESQLYTNDAELNILLERKKYIKSQLTDEENKLSENVANTINERLFSLKNEIVLIESELISAVVQQGEGHEIVKTLTIKLNKLKDNLQKETRMLIAKGMSVADPIQFRQSLVDSVISVSAFSAMLETKSVELKKLVDKYQIELGELPEKVLEFTRLTRNLNIQNQTYSLMMQKLEEAKINEASQVGKVRVVDLALAYNDRIKPKKKLNILMGLIIGLSMGLGVAFSIEYFDKTIKTIDYIEKLGISILALIPSINKDNNRSKRKTKKYQQKVGNVEKLERRLITHEDPKSPVSESYRSLRTSLMYTSVNPNSKGNVILVSSSGPGEGKTTTIMNLAITYANLGKKTILIDTDLRKPVTHKVFSVDREPGITKYLSGIDKDFNSIIKKTEIENLDLITCGIVPPNPSEILASDAMKILIESLKGKYDVVLFDAPPLLAVTDAFVCMKYVDQFILVIRSGQTDKFAFDRALDLIRQSESPLSGVVVNDVDSSNSYGGGYYYNYYQYYYGSETD